MCTEDICGLQMDPIFTTFCWKLHSCALVEGWWAIFQGSIAGRHSWLPQVSLAAQLLANHQESRRICQLALQHDHLQPDPACSTRHTNANRR